VLIRAVSLAVTIMPPATRQPAPTLGPRAQATTALIIGAAKDLFLEQGYLGTRIEQITDRAGISKASFYTYFPSKRDVFLALGQHVYRSIMKVIDSFDVVPMPPTRGAIEQWVARYWEFMEEFGAFILIAVSAGPPVQELRTLSQDVQLRAARHLGRSLRARQPHPHGDEAALGLSVLAMIERSWFFARVACLPMETGALLAAQSDLIEQLLSR